MIVIAAIWCLFSAGAAEPGYWSTRDVAQYLGVPESTVRYWRYKGTGPRSRKIGRRRKYRPAEVEAWAESKADELVTPSPAPRTRRKAAAKTAASPTRRRGQRSDRAR